VASQAREQWSSQVGFVFAAVGSAVGLGNMWRFSYLTAEKGGAAFVALYVFFTLLIGLPLMLAELTIGRGAQRSPIQALAHFGGPAWRWLGALFVAAGFLIACYYGVIAGWTLRYTGAAILGFGEDPAAYFGEVSQGADSLFFHLVFMVMTMGIIVGGVKGGIERASIVAMPLLFVLVCGIALYASTLDGAGAGYRYYLNADFTNALEIDVIVSAAGQAFFSLSLGMGALLTFASYLPRDANLPGESLLIGGADFAVAFLAGLMVFPLIFALGLSGDVSGSTMGALFVALPKAFVAMGTAGRVVGTCFFLALMVGALTSAVSVVEALVAALIDGLGWSRKRAALTLGVIITALGAPAAFDTNVLGVMDQVANDIFLVGGGLGLAIFVGWAMKDPIGEVSAGASGVRWFGLWRGLLRFVVPVVLVFILWNSVPSALAAVAGLFGG
jgi:NSS family neurotransmitter:Na+ symporter